MSNSRKERLIVYSRIILWTLPQVKELWNFNVFLFFSLTNVGHNLHLFHSQRNSHGYEKEKRKKKLLMNDEDKKDKGK